jgi:hypothetical protein
MSVTIDSESKRYSIQSIDFDNFRERLRTENNIYIFPNPNIYTLEKNLFYLLKYSTEKELDTKYFMKPEYLSEDEYGNPSLWLLLMYVNNVFSKEDFTMGTVVVPSFESIVTICKDNFTKVPASDLRSVLL